MSQDVKDYVQTCDFCQRNKTQRQKPYGLLHPIEPPKEKFMTYSMDFIGPLPVTKEGYDGVVVIVEMLTKMVVIEKIKMTYRAPKIAEIFFKEIVMKFGIPKKIVSDRDAQFTSIFWRNIFKMTGTELAMSTAYHPQTDGQTERVNQVVEQILRNYINYRQDDWDIFLPAVAYAINTAENQSTGFTPYQMIYGVNTKGPIDFIGRDEEVNPTVKEFSEQMMKMTTIARDQIIRAQAKQKEQVDKHRRSHDFKVGDLVLVSNRNMMIDRRRSRKLGFKFIGPFKIIRQISPETFELDGKGKLPSYQRFHVNLLKPYHENKEDLFPKRVQEIPEPDVIGDDLEYEVQEILDKRHHRNKVQYLVRWTGYQDYDATWEPRENLTNANLKIKEFEELRKIRKRSTGGSTGESRGRVTKEKIRSKRATRRLTSQGGSGQMTTRKNLNMIQRKIDRERFIFSVKKEEPQGEDAETTSIKEGGKTSEDVSIEEKLKNKPWTKMNTTYQLTSFDDTKKPLNTRLIQRNAPRKVAQKINGKWQMIYVGQHEVIKDCECRDCKFHHDINKKDPRVRKQVQKPQYKPQGEPWVHKSCKYCKARGHTIEECLKKKYGEITKAKYAYRKEKEEQMRLIPTDQLTLDKWICDVLIKQFDRLQVEEEKDEWKEYSLFSQPPQLQKPKETPKMSGLTMEMNKMQGEAIKDLREKINEIRKEMEKIPSFQLQVAMGEALPQDYNEKANLYGLRKDLDLWKRGVEYAKKASPVNSDYSYQMAYQDFNFWRGECPQGLKMYSYRHDECFGCTQKIMFLRSTWEKDLAEERQKVTLANTLMNMSQQQSQKQEEKWEDWQGERKEKERTYWSTVLNDESEEEELY